MRSTSIGRVAAVVGVLACLTGAAFAPGHVSADPPSAALTRFEAGLTSVASQYRAWGRVDDELRWAPDLCRLPLPSLARISRAADTTPHGQKLFFVYARDRAAYQGATRAISPTRPAEGVTPIGQMVVKEAFAPVRIRAYPRDMDAIRPAMRDGHAFGAGAFRGLYVVARVGRPNTPGTDRGWLYGTLDPQGRVTSAGRIGSCMSCHVDAPHDRLFGLADDQSD